jgi:uncharacterized membrane protein YvbJ
MICRQCGIQIADKALICYRCGTATTEAKFQPVKRSRRRISPVAIGALIALLLAILAIVLVFLR